VGNENKQNGTYKENIKQEGVMGMQASLSKQELQGALDSAKSRIIERMVSKSEVQGACDNARDRILSSMNTIFQYHQQYIRQVCAQTDQQNKRAANIELRITSMEQELKSLKQIMFNLVEEHRQLNGVLEALPDQIARYSYNIHSDKKERKSRSLLRTAYNTG
jgi:cell division protein FtsB